MSIDRYGILIGDTRIIYFYALIIMLGVVFAAVLSTRRAPKYSQDPEKVWDILTWVIIAGVIGARLWHVLTPSPSLVAQGITTEYYFTHPLELINTRQGGLGIPGAVIGGALALFIFVRIKKLSFLTWLDIVAPGLILAQAIGRWGNFVNQELYGAPTSLPWAIYIDPDHRLPGFQNFAYYHPTFLYESILNLGVFFLLLWVERRFWGRLKSGDIFLVYLIGYPIVRIFMETLRLDSSTVAGINANQAVMIAVLIVAVALLFIRHRIKPKEEPVIEGENPE
jgi:phosphatidylglycerol:prolipoprotein diacylglycerol transferase